MKYILGAEFDLPSVIGKKYFFSPLHRPPVSPDKSKWEISLEQEINCFTSSHRLGWIELNLVWGIIICNNKLEKIGTNGHNESLKIAKYIDSSNSKIWHGYPADYVRKAQDRPSTDVLLKWQKDKIIQKHQLLKIRQGKPCNL